MTASFLNGFKISDIDQLILALILHNILEWSKKLDVKFSRVFIRCKDILLNLNFFVFFFPLWIINKFLIIKFLNVIVQYITCEIN